MTKPPFRRLRYWTAYPAWIAFCAILVLMVNAVASSSAPPALDGQAAGQVALRHVRSMGPEYAGHEVVHVAKTRAGETGPEARFVVLCDREERSGLRHALVVELSAESGEVLEVREPETTGGGALLPQPLQLRR
jgi:hypothetical protein